MNSESTWSWLLRGITGRSLWDKVQLQILNPVKAGYRLGLGLSNFRRYEISRDLVDLERYISNLQTAVDLTTEHPDKPIYLFLLGLGHLIRCGDLGELSDVEAAVQNLQMAVDLTSDEHPNKPMYLSSLGLGHFSRFERLGEFSDVEASISNLQKAVNLTTDDNPDKPTYLHNLGSYRLVRFERLGGLSDIAASEAELQRAVDLATDDDPSKAGYLSDLSHSQFCRFERLGEQSDVEASISNIQRAVDLSTDGHPDKAAYYCNLGTSQVRRFEHLGELPDIESSISNIQRAVDLSTDGHPDNAVYFGNLGLSQLRRFERLGELPDVEASISNSQRAVDLAIDGHPNKAMYFGNLGLSQLRRFERLGELPDLEASISNIQRAVDLATDGHPDKAAYYCNLGISQRHRFERLGELPDVEASISNIQRAVDLAIDGHPNKAMYFGNLGLSQLRRFERLDELPDLEASISNIQRAVDLTTDRHLNKAVHFGNLGLSQLRRFERLGELPDVEASISNIRRAVDIITDDDPSKSMHLISLGDAFLLSMKAVTSKNDSFMKASVAFRAAAQLNSAYPLVTLDAAQRWARISHLTGDLYLALDGYRTALEILPKVVWLGSDIISQQSSLVRGESEDITSDSAACAVEVGLFEEAVEFLDAGRSLVWQQASALQMDLKMSPDECPESNELVEELRSVGRQLAQGRFSDFPSNPQEVSVEFSQKMLDGIKNERRRLAGRWDELVKLIRKRPTFEDFLKPTGFQKLRQAAAGGLVVIINVSVYRVDALVVDVTQPVQHIPLPGIDAETITKLSTDITSHRPSLVASTNERRFYTRKYLRPALRRVWADIVVPIFNKLRIPLDSSEGLLRRRIWWYPTGPLTFIPIHAAGPFNDTDDIDVSHLVISSYTTTLISLIQAQEKTTLSKGRPKFLIVSQPNTPGQSSLPRSSEEVDRVLKVIRTAGVSSDSVLCLRGSDATTEKVVDAMNSCSWLHFACHGVQDPDSGMKSAFLLHDGDLPLSQIASKQLCGQFAFLSVCHGASGLQELPGEAMHLAATLQFVGFPNVVATMWGIKDEDALQVADMTYRHMLLEEQRGLDPLKAAVALNAAIRILRRNPDVTLDRWIPFIHIGV